MGTATTRQSHGRSSSRSADRKPFGQGLVQSFTLKTKVHFDSNGQPTADSLKAIKVELGTSPNSPEAGQDPDSIRLNYFKTSSLETENLEQWITYQQEQSDGESSPTYNVLGYNCAMFCVRGLEAAGVIAPQVEGLYTHVPNDLYDQLSAQQNLLPKGTVKVTECDFVPMGLPQCN